MGFIDYVAEYFRGPAGEPGPQGDPGPEGPQGPAGTPNGMPGRLGYKIYRQQVGRLSTDPLLPEFVVNATAPAGAILLNATHRISSELTYESAEGHIVYDVDYTPMDVSPQEPFFPKTYTVTVKNIDGGFYSDTANFLMVEVGMTVWYPPQGETFSEETTYNSKYYTNAETVEGV